MAIFYPPSFVPYIPHQPVPQVAPFIGEASASIIVTAEASTSHIAVRSASASIVVTATASGRVAAVYQVDASAFMVLRTMAIGTGGHTPLGPIATTFRTPHVRIYNLDTMQLVDVVNLAHLRYARVGQIYSLPLRLTTSYPVGRYGVLYQAPVGDFVGAFLGLFEVVAGGDGGGPVIASYTVTESTGDLVLGQLGSGAVVVGQKPGVT